MLRNEYGWAGEGKFWALNNRIAQAESCLLDISKKYNKASLANDLQFTVEELDEYICFLVSECELVFITAEGLLSTSIIQETFLNVSDNRKRNKTFYEKNALKDKVNKIKHSKDTIQYAETDIQLTELTQSKVKESKAKENKVDQIAINHIIADLNERLGTKYSAYGNKTQEIITARINEGFNRDDFILVNQKKCDEWRQDTAMCKYLRPETLYSRKFESYLNQLSALTPTPIDKVSTAFNELEERNNDTERRIADNLEKTFSHLSESANIRRIN
tara:strand:- start:242 stop:1066 length:825 start_codon:yes stop_codon:yes gene_type:complete